MAAPVKSQEILARSVRELSLKMIHRYLSDTSKKNEKFRKDLLLKITPTVLPRITKLSGDEDGTPLQINIVKYGDNTPQV